MKINELSTGSAGGFRVTESGQVLGIAPVPVIQIQSGEFQQYLKRFMDIVLASIFIIILLPLFALISLAIKLSSAGPVLFKQQRVGFKGRVFTMWKFRTMKADTPAGDHKKLIKAILTQPRNGRNNLVEQYKHQVDNHIIFVGKILRKTSLDELPQLFNVLKGELSLVGPRPHPLYEVEHYKRWHFKRLQIMPGLTGLSKVKLRCTPENYDESMRLDVEYIENWSLGLDLKIIAKTIALVICMTGAY